MMKSKTPLAAFAALIVAGLFVVNAVMAVSRGSSTAPPGTFEIQPDINFGEVSGRKDIYGVVTIRNNTDQEVLLDPIIGSCGCITVGKAARVPAKSDAEFQFKFRTPSTWGVFKHSIRFVAGNASYETKIRGKVTTVK